MELEIVEIKYCMGDKILNEVELIIELEKQDYYQRLDKETRNKEIEEYIKKINEECLEVEKTIYKKKIIFFMDKDNTKKTEIKAYGMPELQIRKNIEKLITENMGRSMLELQVRREQARKLVIHGKITIILLIALLILGVLISTVIEVNK